MSNSLAAELYRPEYRELCGLILKLRGLLKGGLASDDELGRFFDLAEPMQKAAREAVEAEAREAGRTATHADLHAASVRGLLAAAPHAAAEVWGAAIGELFGGAPAQ